MSTTATSTTTALAAKWTSGLITVTLPKDTLAVITATTDAQYTQSVTIDDGSGADEPQLFKGSGQGKLPMKLKGDSLEYLKIEPSSSERQLGLSFFYAKKAGSDAWQSPRVQGPLVDSSLGFQVIRYGTEDAKDESFHDTSLSIALFPKVTPKKN